MSVDEIASRRLLMPMKVWVTRDVGSVGLQLWDAAHSQPVREGRSFYAGRPLTLYVGMLYAEQAAALGLTVADGECLPFTIPDWVPGHGGE